VFALKVRACNRIQAIFTFEHINMVLISKILHFQFFHCKVLLDHIVNSLAQRKLYQPIAPCNVRTEAFVKLAQYLGRP
jgi:hypothetical protein